MAVTHWLVTTGRAAALIFGYGPLSELCALLHTLHGRRNCRKALMNRFYKRRNAPNSMTDNNERQAAGCGGKHVDAGGVWLANVPPAAVW